MGLELPAPVLELLGGREVLCGFSGGADSSALLLLLRAASERAAFSLKAVHFEHGLRGVESEADALHCEAFCAARGIPFERISLDVPGRQRPGEGVEAAARRLRLERWTALASGERVAVALGHNADDRIENLLLRLFRGSNSSGLSSMRFAQRLAGVLFVRPLLEFPRAAIEAYLREAGVEAWRFDSSNADEAYKRNFLRNSLLPSLSEELPYARPGMAHSLKALEDDALCLEALALERLAALESAPAEHWLATPSALRVRVLRLWLSDRLESDFVPDSALVARFDAELAKASTEAAAIPLRERDEFLSVSVKGLEILRSSTPPDAEWNWRVEPVFKWGRLLVEARMESGPMTLPADNWSALFDAASLPETLSLGVWREGERMSVLGRQGASRLKELFNKAGVSSAERPERPALRLPDGTVLWIPGVRRSAELPAYGDAARVAFSARLSR